MFKRSRYKKSNYGGVIILALAFVMITAVSMFYLFSYVHSINRINEYNIAREKAAMAAEAGVLRLIHYFNPSNWNDLAGAPDGDPDGNAAKIEAFWDAFKNLPTSDTDKGLAARDLVWGNPAPDETLMTIVDGDFNDNLIVFGPSRVVELKVKAPRTDAPAGTVMTFYSRAGCRLKNGDMVYRTAIMDVNFAQGVRITVPGGIVSGGTVGANGHFNLHWGEAWAKGEIQLKLNRKYTNKNQPPWNWRPQSDNNQVGADTDQWVKFITANGFIKDDNGDIIVDDSNISNVGALSTNLEKYGNILYQFMDRLTPPGEQTLSQKIDAVIEQYAKLNDPSKGYLYWKQTAIQRDTYFRVAADGKVYDAYGNYRFASATAAMDYYRSLPNVYVAFFDTKDGNPPNAYPPSDNRSNWADITFTGSLANCSKGLLYVAGNLKIGGSGRPPAIKILNPTEIENNVPRESASTTAEVFHDGVIFTYGDFEYQGNPIIYGAVVTRGKYDCGGTPNVYYNARLKTGEPQTLSTPVRIVSILLPSGAS